MSGRWYDIKCGVKGEVDGKYQQFPTEDEYYEYLRETEKTETKGKEKRK